MWIYGKGLKIWHKLIMLRISHCMLNITNIMFNSHKGVLKYNIYHKIKFTCKGWENDQGGKNGFWKFQKH